ncbi:hypothetical protein PYCCODRAFT_163722 [Trametes coccinea BRFM310]|uniref:Uncharacterized protein n=1 Tax=Trametes coccinea (strain BRFM310) TaxID=1353009 RepID=A0A1Y2IS81_TRAC3|nr:hypothetical protein PYCCODRAFT_163722 [Trametes coccinea BRFM310]
MRPALSGPGAGAEHPFRQTHAPGRAHGAGVPRPALRREPHEKNQPKEQNSRISTHANLPPKVGSQSLVTSKIPNERRPCARDALNSPCHFNCSLGATHRLGAPACVASMYALPDARAPTVVQLQILYLLLRAHAHASAARAAGTFSSASSRVLRRAFPASGNAFRAMHAPPDL